ncbi:hypothetical protein GOP47_0010231 [Adiantum capillus-veneris]|uniref:Glutamine amidotransferase type-2 domain-containing protein n=1 Tax=Adiantum capillus-veneris TaxID=13818 RepID=A0A9D4UUW9_ADICA|nr:hypothetical protein GOP47_0010231 [Adiantum capillus-veneris]
MCGIGLVVSSSAQPEQLLNDGRLLVGDLLEALKRRGPDTMGKHTICLPTRFEHNIKKPMEPDGDMLQTHERNVQVILEFLATTLQLRGSVQICQPLKDLHENVLIYNGEVFDGPVIESNENDAQVLLDLLGDCCSCLCHAGCASMDGCTCLVSERDSKIHISVPEFLSTIKGPWALVFWQAKSGILWFGRDVLGRRSLLIHWPCLNDQRLILSSVCPPFDYSKSTSTLFESGIFEYWEELPCGIYSIHINAGAIKNIAKRAVKHSWKNAVLIELIGWKRDCIEPPPEHLDVASQSACDDLQLGRADLSVISTLNAKTSHHVQVLASLQESVRRRTSNISEYWKEDVKSIHAPLTTELKMETPFAILFSGGLDSMILAAIADQSVPSHWSIDLLNISFEGQTAPDRITAIAGVKELSTISRSRRWRLVEIDGDPSSLPELHGHLLSLICPSKTHMDLNIGTALWLAAQGHGWVTENSIRKEYKCKARVILVGSGADEQCAGYGRHRTKYREGGWKALEREMQLDMQRLWKRNLGRDDRCIADHGKEARFPYLDEDVIHSLLSVPLWDIADLRKPPGQGDKKFLREIALLLGLKTAANLPKRAIQFGSRIAQESNRRNFGSNRAANQASVGSAVLHDLRKT